ncbi:MAG TPA: 4-hydroxybenzoate octaprenyltransferase, partial [Gammaproteobacteria bacterium]|nr:4-hydroxybenzoate octaprenyltransferase [Gammaproteobacteria bacterium]
SYSRLRVYRSRAQTNMNTTLTAYIQLMRLDKPVGTLLALYPVLFALWFANAGMPPLELLLIFILGTFIMRTAGCVVNDVVDQKFDKHVRRTQMRPLAQGVLSTRHAIILFIGLMLAALFLVLQLNTLTFYLALAVAGLTVFYPWCKRYTYGPQFILGVVFNAGVLLAYSASLNALPATAWLLFSACLCWTLAYDTLYAMADREDDLKLGLKSTALLFGAYPLHFITLFYLLFFAGLVYMGLITGLKPVFFLSLLLAIVWTAYQIIKVHAHTDLECIRAFRANSITGFLTFSGILFAYL